MVGEVLSGMVSGVKGEFVTVQADVAEGLPVFHMIGYLSSEVKEARERVRSSFKNMGLRIPPKRIAVNLAPADIKKTGTYFDVAIALSLFVSLGFVPPERVKPYIVLGELSLDGSLSPIIGVLPIIKYASEMGIHACIVPYDNAKEASFVDHMEVFAFRNLKELLDFLTDPVDDYVYVDEEHVSEESGIYKPMDLSHVKGQRLAKRAIEIAVAGCHNLYLDGPPGVGKSLLASCIPGLMPPMSKEEQLEVTMIYSVKGLLRDDSSLVKVRPFRNPTHASTVAGIFGGGVHPKPGEVSLAHHGVLFLDEFPEFRREVIDMFRVPLESHEVNLVRYDRTIQYPADFILVVAANPCPCGYFPDRSRCHCTFPQINAYRNKISGPIMDRIDLYVRCERVTFEELMKDEREESTQTVKERIEKAWQIQLLRSRGNGSMNGKENKDGEYKEGAEIEMEDRGSKRENTEAKDEGAIEKTKIRYNGRLTPEEIQDYCRLDQESLALMEQVYDRMHLTGRAYHKLLKVARTIADLDGKEWIEKKHIEEALLFRQHQAGSYSAP